MNRNKIVYSLSVEDIQTVSEEVYGRKLSDEEIKTIIDPIGDRIEWYEAIEDAISYVLRLEPQGED